jgi:cytochrome b
MPPSSASASLLPNAIYRRALRRIPLERIHIAFALTALALAGITMAHRTMTRPLPPVDIFGYLTGLFRGRPKHYIGHNPAGGAMVCMLLLVLGTVTLTGLLTYGAEGQGPFAIRKIWFWP